VKRMSVHISPVDKSALFMFVGAKPPNGDVNGYGVDDGRLPNGVLYVVLLTSCVVLGFVCCYAAKFCSDNNEEGTGAKQQQRRWLNRNNNSNACTADTNC